MDRVHFAPVGIGGLSQPSLLRIPLGSSGEPLVWAGDPQLCGFLRLGGWFLIRQKDTLAMFGGPNCRRLPSASFMCPLDVSGFVSVWTMFRFGIGQFSDSMAGNGYRGQSQRSRRSFVRRPKVERLPPLPPPWRRPGGLGWVRKSEGGEGLCRFGLTSKVGFLWGFASKQHEHRSRPLSRPWESLCQFAHDSNETKPSGKTLTNWKALYVCSLSTYELERQDGRWIKQLVQMGS